MAAYYEPYTGRYRRAALAYGPYRGWGRGALYDFRSGAYVRGATAWGPLSATTSLEAYHPDAGTHAARPETRSVYDSWGPTVATRGHDWAAEEHRRAAASSHTYVRAPPNPDAETGAPADLYVGPDRKVYRRDGDSWSRVGSQGEEVAGAAEGGPFDREQEIQDEQARLEQNLQDDINEAEGWNVPPGGVVLWPQTAVVLNEGWRARRYTEVRRRSYQQQVRSGSVQGRVRRR
jgi:hypothetical protein